MILFKILHPRVTQEHLGLLPFFFAEEDKRSAVEQLKANYIGGWHHLPMWKMSGETLKYPGDPPLKPIARAALHGKETLLFYEREILAIVQPDGTFEASRID